MADSTAPTMLTLVRHGETEYNRTDRYMGRRDEPLNARGCAQAAAVAQRIADTGGAGVLYSSPLARARETAEFIERALGLSVAVEEGFTEIDLGPWEDRDRGELARENSPLWQLWRTHPLKVRVEGMENVAAVRRRVGQSLDRLVRKHAGRHIIVVSHFVCVVSAVLHVLKLPGAAYRGFVVHNCSLTRIRFGQVNTLQCFNDTSHVPED